MSFDGRLRVSCRADRLLKEAYLEIGDQTSGDEVEYPDDDLKATQVANGGWILTHKDGRPYE